MRRLERPPAPACLATDTEERAQAHRDRYANRQYPGGKLKALWNDLDKDERGVAAPRRTLLVMSGDECAYCGLWVGNDHMQVDHILPKEAFPFLVYAWDRLVDPSFDEPSEHVELLMDIPAYRPRTPIGEHTYARLFHHREIAERLRKVRELARIVIERDMTPEETEVVAIASSHPSLFHRFAAYWRAARQEGLLVR